MSRDTDTNRCVTMAAIMILLTSGLVAGAQSAWALPGREVVGASSLRDSKHFKRAVARCPPNKHVIGGGGWAKEFPAQNHKLTQKQTLTELRPTRGRAGARDAYRVAAAEITPGTPEPWLVEAYAVCADAGALPGWSIKRSRSVSSSSAVKAKAAVCPTGRRVLGTGISTSRRGGNVVLQVARPSRTGDIARAQAHEDADGYSGDWLVAAYAICATPPSGYVIPPFERTMPLEYPPSESPTQAFGVTVCPTGKSLLSSGAGLGSNASGRLSLQAIYPEPDPAPPGRASAMAAENTPTNENWGFAVASAVCAS